MAKLTFNETYDLRESLIKNAPENCVLVVDDGIFVAMLMDRLISKLDRRDIIIVPIKKFAGMIKDDMQVVIDPGGRFSYGEQEYLSNFLKTRQEKFLLRW